MKNKGITLIALVITIVVLIILAAVAINLSLGNNGIFNRAKTAKEQYANAQDYEENQITKASSEIDNYVDGNRGTVTLTEEEYTLFKSQFSNNGKVSIYRPDTWTAGTEYDFGNNLYGVRATGTNTAKITTIYNPGVPVNFVDMGGRITHSNGNIGAFGNGHASTLIYSSDLFQKNTSYSDPYSISLEAGDNIRGYYDVWVIYTKQTN